MRESFSIKIISAMFLSAAMSFKSLSLLALLPQTRRAAVENVLVGCFSLKPSKSSLSSAIYINFLNY